jgi:hypothetical protein
VRAGGVGWRVDNCIFNSASFKVGVWATDNIAEPIQSAGLIDNCQFYNSRALVFGTAFMLNEGNQQNILYNLPVSLGNGPAATYIENNYFEFNVSGNAIDANYGGAYVFRYNTLKNVYAECHSMLGGNRATRFWELYGNTFERTGTYFWYPIYLRGGTGIVFDNTFKGLWSNFGTIVDNRRSFDTNYVSSICDGSSTLDGNEDSTGYPCRDQIGRGNDTQLWNYSSPGAYTQPLIPAYVFNNRRHDNNALAPMNVAGNSSQHIKANRDFYNQTDSFNGTSGVGRGTLASRPSTCTTGVGYWATDQGDWNKSGSGGQGVLYKCVSTNTWEAYYTPYEYPHPLRSIGV